MALFGVITYKKDRCDYVEEATNGPKRAGKVLMSAGCGIAQAVSFASADLHKTDRAVDTSIIGFKGYTVGKSNKNREKTENSRGQSGCEG